MSSSIAMKTQSLMCPQLLLGRKFLLRLSVEPASDQVSNDLLCYSTKNGSRTPLHDLRWVVWLVCHACRFMRCQCLCCVRLARHGTRSPCPEHCQASGARKPCVPQLRGAGRSLVLATQVPAAAEAIAQDTRLGERAAAYTVSHEAMHEHEDGSAELERAPVDAAAAEGADGITAADVVEDTLFEAVPLSFLEGSDVAMQANAAIAGA